MRQLRVPSHLSGACGAMKRSALAYGMPLYMLIPFSVYPAILPCPIFAKAEDVEISLRGSAAVQQRANEKAKKVRMCFFMVMVFFHVAKLA